MARPGKDELHNESDVEQKLVYPLLTSAAPEGLGFSAKEIRTKSNIRSLKIGKGASTKIYYPDYLGMIAGFPASDPRS